MRRLLYVLPVAFFIVVAGYFTLALKPGYDPHALPSPLIDRPAPEFALAALGGGKGFSRDALAGQVTVINFFASWCVPCRAEHPLLLRLAEQEHVALYGIAYKDKAEDTARFIAQLGDPYRSVGLDESGRTGIDFGITGVPETFVLDKAGHVRRHYGAPLSPEEVKDDLLPLLHELEGT
jgi:cytochrome c biogenesis protein CcmG, thiol:disulfide interchange protein DsbE